MRTRRDRPLLEAVNLSALLRRDAIDPPVVIRTPRSIHDISHNLQTRANDWRESAIPEVLRKIGINKLILEGVGEQLTLEWGGRTSPVNNPACFITVVRLPTGGCEVTARFGRGTLRVFATLLLLSSPLQLLLDGGAMRWYFVAAQVAISLAFLITGRSNTPLLKEQLLKVVEQATRSAAAPPADRALPRDDTVPRLSP